MDIEDFLIEKYYWGDVYATWVENDVCRTCRKSISGTAFIYRGRDMFFHLSCLNAPTNYKALMLHFGSRRHDPLIFTEELKNDGKNDVFCFGCEKLVLGSRYKCSTSQCNLALHQSCAELPLEIQQHPFHPNHNLVLVKPEKKHCNSYGKNCNAYPFYYCIKCDFNLDFECATCIQINNTQDCQHSFISFLKENQFTCEACGEEGKELASLCSICQLLIHSKCARFPCIITITKHDHSLALTYSLRQVKEHNTIFCDLCYQKVKTKFATYYCQKCSYVAHLACAFKYEKNVHLTWLPEESIDLETNVMEVEGAGQIQHFSHEHDLIINNEKLVDDKPCDGCMGLMSTPFYSCTQCNFFLHNRCAQLKREKNHQLHEHQLTLISKVPKFGKLFSCDACKRLNNNFSYRCDMCDFNLDLQCCSISKTIKHEGHQHSLFLAINSNRRCDVCNCTSIEKPGVFVCINCDFALGFECATLPLNSRNKFDDHLLILTYSAETHCKEYYCLICEEERDAKHWYYYCAECDFSAHTQCVLGKDPYIKFGRTFTSKNFHQHPLTYVPKTESSPPCVGCGKTFNGVAVECTQCRFIVHLSRMCLRKITNKLTLK